ncbi:TetR/AcrR family transcriptional regulator [Nonomuraea sp. NPDC050556]|uniref:TetR/AcrR family transcriptional regulator n=1 Tax=Nonomuraea sp. NPDC050556 TaxID=3364369 RepID=UPI0037B614E9
MAYHHGDLRGALLDAAEALVRERGVEGWSLREASARVGVSPSAAYHHFASRDALVAALAGRVLTTLGERLRQAANTASSDPASSDPASSDPASRDTAPVAADPRDAVPRGAVSLEAASARAASVDMTPGDAPRDTAPRDTARGDAASGEAASAATAFRVTTSRDAEVGDTAANDTAANDTASSDMALGEAAFVEAASGDVVSGGVVSGDRQRRLVAFGKQYVWWAVEDPAVARLVFGAGPETFVSPHPHDVLVDEIDRLGLPPGADFAIWATVHGLAVLVIDGLVHFDDHEAVGREAERLVRAVLTGLAAETPPPTPWPTPRTAQTERQRSDPR